jgi:hypothetical protein
MKPTHLTSLHVAAIAASQLGATDCGQIITDRGFDLWCGDRLCYWKPERGDVAQVPTGSMATTASRWTATTSRSRS